MSASKDKTILFARAEEGKTVHQWPVAVFNTVADGRTYAAFLKMAQTAGNPKLQLALDPAHKTDAEGVPLPGVKWSLATVAYAPTPALDDEDSATSPPAHTS